MWAAIEETGIPEPHASVLRAYFEEFSLAMINQPGESVVPPGLQPLPTRRPPPQPIETLEP
jgi:hypothetical protein